MRKTDSQKADHITRTLNWRKGKLEEGYRRLETFFSESDHDRLKEIAKEDGKPVAGLIREIVKGWLNARK